MLTLEILAVLALLLALLIHAMIRSQWQRRASAALAGVRQGARILIVDDDPDFARITKRILETHGYDTLTVSSGTDALKVLYYARGNRPDLVLLDIMMDYVTDGLDVRRIMQQNPDLRHIPVVMITSLTGVRGQSILPHREYAQATGWLAKPVRADQLVDVVKSSLATSPTYLPSPVPVAS
jgi:chemosensory pili system protein ChpA (sensor histidine kinase/response regulator)